MQNPMRVGVTSLMGVLAAAAVISGCSSSSSGGGGTTTSTGGGSTSTGGTSAANPTGSPIVIGQVVTLTSPAFQFTAAGKAFNASVDAINAAGGVDGHPLVAKTCDDQGSATVAAQCATKLISQDKVLAIGGNVSGYTSPVLAAAKASKVPTFCSTEIEKGTANYPEFYACAPLTVGYAQAALLFQPQWKTVAYVTYAGYPSSASLVEQGQKVAGTSNIQLKVINVPPTTTDWTPIAAQVKSLGANAVLSQLAGSGDQALLQAMQTEDVKIPYLETSGQASSSTIETAAKAGVQYNVASSWINDPALSSVRKQELADFAKYAPGIDDTTSDSTNNAWLFPQLLKLAAQSGELSTFTRSSIADWASSQTSLKTGITAPLDWKNNGPLSGEPRFVNLYAIVEEYTPPSTTPATQDKMWESLSYSTKQTLPMN